MRALDQETPAAVVIVNYFKARRLLEGLRSLGHQTVAGALSISVVENSAVDEERRVLAEATGTQPFVLVEPPSNIGYTRGCNLGVSSLPWARYVLLCNPDIIWDQADAIEQLIAMADADPSIGVLAPLQYGDDGRPVETARTFPTLFEQVRRRLTPKKGSELHICERLFSGASHSLDVDWVQSSCVIIRRSLWDSIGGLNQRYFLFMSDVELGHATWKAGYRVCLTSVARVRTDGRRASSGGLKTLFTSQAQRSHLRDALIFYFMHGLRKLQRKGGPAYAISEAARTEVVL